MSPYSYIPGVTAYVLNVTALTFDEYADGKIQFNLTNNCITTTRSVLKLSKKLGNRFSDQCSIFFPLKSDGNELCDCRLLANSGQPPDGSQTDPSSHLTCQFRKRMERSDNTLWKLWSGGRAKVMVKLFTVNVTCE